jgi:hypothetical protein
MSIPEDSVWEIPYSDDDSEALASPEANENSTPAWNDAKHEHIDLAQFFPKGRGILRPIATTNSSPSSEQPGHPEQQALRRSNRNKSAVPINYYSTPVMEDTDSKPSPDPPSDETRDTTPGENTFTTIPTFRTSGKPTKIMRNRVPITPWTPEELHTQNIKTYNNIIANIEVIHARYKERPTDLLYDPKYDSTVQWPIPHSNSGNRTINYCRCRSRMMQKQEKSRTQQCYDPGCEVPHGWYHLTCLLDDELKNLLSMGSMLTSPPSLFPQAGSC